MAKRTSEATEKPPREMVDMTIQGIPFRVWKAAKDEASRRMIPVKQVWIEAVARSLGVDA